MLTVSIAVVVLSGVMYHICQKAISHDAHPLVSLIITYSIAIVLSCAAFSIFPLRQGITESFRQPGWATYALGFAIFGLEAGYLLAYRYGADLGATAIYTNAAIAVLLIPAAMIMFGENLSISRITGIILCIMGFILINRK